MISFKGFNENCLTFLAEDELNVNTPVKFAENKTVAVCDEDDEVCGVAVSENGGIAAVQVTGFIELPCDDSTVTEGYIPLVCDGAGGVKKGTDSNRKFLVLGVDRTRNVCGFIL